MKIISVGLFSNNRNIFVFICATFVCFVLFTSCKSHGTDPVETYKDPFSMTWKCDTLMNTNGLQTMMNHLYVSSVNNIWASGHCDCSVGDLWKYNGSNWSMYNLLGDITTGVIGLNGLLGFSSDNIWMVGERDYWSSTGYRTYKPLILRYNGTKWSEIIPDIPNLGIRVLSICGNSSNDLWMGSEKGVILHYKSGSWTLDTIKVKMPATTGSGIGRMVMYKGKPFIMLSLNDGTLGQIKSYYYTGEYRNWKLLDSTVIDQTHYINTAGNYYLYVSKSGRLFSCGDNGIWEWTNDQWQQKLVGNMALDAMYGAGDDYLLAVGVNSYFYDGSKWKKMDFLESKSGEYIEYTGVWTDGKEVFISGYSAGNGMNKTYIWHGK